jgi:hypothetical protein
MRENLSSLKLKHLLVLSDSDLDTEEIPALDERFRENAQLSAPRTMAKA